MDKSYVTMEQRVCPVCGVLFDTNALLLDRRLRKVFEHKTTTGWGFCPAHESLREQGYVALVEIDKCLSRGTKPDEVHRLGRIAHMRRAAFEEWFPDIDAKEDIVWADSDLLDLLQKKADEAVESQP